MNASSCTVPAFLATQNLWGQHNGGGGDVGCGVLVGSTGSRVCWEEGSWS